MDGPASSLTSTMPTSRRSSTRRNCRAPLPGTELIRILEGRRNRILRRYLLRLSSLEHPTVEEGEVPVGGPVVCVEDRAERIGLGPAPAPTAKLWYSSNTAMVLPRSQRAPAVTASRFRISASRRGCWTSSPGATDRARCGSTSGEAIRRGWWEWSDRRATTRRRARRSGLTLAPCRDPSTGVSAAPSPRPGQRARPRARRWGSAPRDRDGPCSRRSTKQAPHPTTHHRARVGQARTPSAAARAIAASACPLGNPNERCGAEESHSDGRWRPRTTFPACSSARTASIDRAKKRPARKRRLQSSQPTMSSENGTTPNQAPTALTPRMSRSPAGELYRCSQRSTETSHAGGSWWWIAATRSARPQSGRTISRGNPRRATALS